MGVTVPDLPRDLGPRLKAARENVGMTLEEVGLLVGQAHTVVSNWETGTRRPNSRMLALLASTYRVSLEELLGEAEPPRPDFARLLFREAAERVDARAKYEIHRFLEFLDNYADLLEAMGEPPGLTRSPLKVVEGFTSKDDVRRKAEEARSFFRLGLGPISDLAGIADLFGVTVYFAPLGQDLKQTISGAFLPHTRVGFSILVNAETTPGRRQFTVAHELAHALFHGDHPYVSYYGRRIHAERFADAFAAEFLVPIESLRASVEALGIAKVRDPEVVVHLQRYYRVSYAMMLVRLRAANLASDDDVEQLNGIRPVHLAESLGYSVEADEWGQDPDMWGARRFPRRFLRLLRKALLEQRITVSGAASLMGLAQEDVEEMLTVQPSTEGDQADFEYLSAAG